VSVSRIRKNDTVVAISGTCGGKTGKVLQVLPTKGSAIVEGLRLVKKAVKKTQETPQGGFVQKEAPVPLSVLMLYCPECKRGVQIRRVLDGESRVRQCRRCSHAFAG
jgi:large subunit ribosomal protein L24